jgi:hypothetical protein
MDFKLCWFSSTPDMHALRFVVKVRMGSPAAWGVRVLSLTAGVSQKPGVDGGQSQFLPLAWPK